MTYTPTSNSEEPSGTIHQPSTTEEQKKQQNSITPSQERESTPPPQPTSNTSARLDLSDPPGFEINLGPITIVFDPSNNYHLSIATIMIGTFLLAKVLRDIKIYQQYNVDHGAIEMAQKSFGTKIESLPKDIVITFPEKKPGLISRILKQEGNEHQETIVIVLSIREDLKKFLRNHRGKLHRDLEDGAIQLLELISKKEIYIPEVLASMERFVSLAERNKEILSGNSVHYAHFITRQFRMAFKKIRQI